jgi:nitrous oxidase accessory protein
MLTLAARVWTMVVMVAVVVIVIVMPLHLCARTVKVYPSKASSAQGINRTNQSLAQAIAAAGAGDTLRLHVGVYAEHDLVITKPLVIVADSAGTANGGEVVIDAGSQGTSIIFIRAGGVTLRGLVLCNVGVSYVEDNAAVRVEGVRECRFEGLQIRNAFFGLYFAKSAACVVTQCVLRAQQGFESSSGNGIHCWRCDSMTVRGNDVRGHRDGIYLEFTRHAAVSNNFSEGNMRYGLHFMFSDSCLYDHNTFQRNGSGVAVMYSRNVQMLRNRFENNWGAAAYGVLFKDITDSYMADNHFVKNTVGLYAEGMSRTIIERNEFVDNGWALRMMGSSGDNSFRTNNVVGNSFDVTTNSFESLNTFAGNYWSRYQGYDLNRDGVGDVPFRPVRLFSVLVEQQQPALVLMHSIIVELLDLAERVIPSMTPETLIDATPAMQPHYLEGRTA